MDARLRGGAPGWGGRGAWGVAALAKPLPQSYPKNPQKGTCRVCGIGCSGELCVNCFRWHNLLTNVERAGRIAREVHRGD